MALEMVETAMPLQKVRLIAIVEIVIGLVSLVLFFKYSSTLSKEPCGFASAAQAFLFLTALLPIVGVSTLLLYPFGRWIHIIFSPIIAFIFSGILFILIASTPICRISNQLAYAPVIVFFIMFPTFTIMILFFFLGQEVRKLFKAS